MISLVIVSHSRALAVAARELAAEVAPPDGPVVELAAGLDGGTTGTSATAVAEAVDRAFHAGGGDGVLVLLDLGSAVLSAEMALDLLDSEVAGRVRLSAAPLVEGLVTAVVAAGAGADLDRCAQEAEAALDAKLAHLGISAGAAVGRVTEEQCDQPGAQGADEARAGRVDGHPGSSAVGIDGSRQCAGPNVAPSVELPVVGEHGLHARPAARLVAAVSAGAPATVVRLTNLTSGRGPVDALSLSAVATLGARQGHVLLAEARGPQAEHVLKTLLDLAGRAFGEPPEPHEPVVDVERPLPPTVSTEPGVAGSGLEAAVGTAILFDRPVRPEDLTPGDPAHELETLERALEETLRRLTEVREHARLHLGSGQAEVFAAHTILLQDPELLADARDRVRGGAGAAVAWHDAVRSVAERFAELPDPYQRERAQDVRSIGDRVLRQLVGAAEPEVFGQGVLVVDELDPALAISLDADAVHGVVTRDGGGLGHGVLIAHARGVPVLTGVGALPDVRQGTVIAFDVRSRRLEVDPPPQVRAEFEALLDRRRADRERALDGAHLPAHTRDGVRITVQANVSSLAVARLGAGLGAEGSGLVRTEAVFHQSTRAPSVQEQVEAYGAIATAYLPHPVTIRTWDCGGDKPLPFIPTTPEDNPFLGLRGLRVFRADPSLLLDQLEAICRVAQEHRVNVLFPMVTSADDVSWARDRLTEAAARAGLPGPPPRLGMGIMVEVPAVAIRLGRLARGLDFVSIGSNDLSQYTLAAERGNPRVAAWSDPLEPSVLQLIRYICQQTPEGIPVGLCGHLAADPDVAGLLVGLGVRELSSTAAAVPTVKARLRAASMAELRDLAETALAAPDAIAVRELLGLA